MQATSGNAEEPGAARRPEASRREAKGALADPVVEHAGTSA